MTDETQRSFWIEIASNRVFWSAFISWVIAQTLKVIIGVFREKKFNFKWFVGSGGMPSSHTAAVAGLATAVGLQYRFDSTMFAVAFSFALVTMFDAQGVRRHSGKQAEALNKIVDDLYAMKGIHMEPVKALIGHTPIEVLAGALIGVFVVIMLY